MDTLRLVDRLDDLIHNARSVPLTDQVRVDKEAVYDLLDQMRATLNEEIQAARAIVAEAPAAVDTGPEASALRTLVDAYPRTLALADVSDEVTVARLVDDGLASRFGDGVSATHAASRCAALLGR